MNATQLSPCFFRIRWARAVGQALLSATLIFSFVARPSTAEAQDKTAPVQVHLRQVRDDNGNVPTDLSTPIYRHTSTTHEAIIAPDQHHVTLQVDGSAHITRAAGGTELELELSGLVPNGVYTVWTALFQDPPFNFDIHLPNFPDNVGLGAVGAIDGSESIINADENGNAIYGATITPGPLSIRGEATAYVLDGFSGFAVLGAYHIDGQTYGPVQGPHHVPHFFAGFVPEPPSFALALLLGGTLAGGTVFRASKSP